MFQIIGRSGDGVILISLFSTGGGGGYTLAYLDPGGAYALAYVAGRGGGDNTGAKYAGTPALKYVKIT